LNFGKLRALARRQTGAYGLNDERLATLLTRVRDWNLFLAFNIVDGCTQGKQRDPLRWLFRLVVERVETRFSEADIL